MYLKVEPRSHYGRGSSLWRAVNKASTKSGSLERLKKRQLSRGHVTIRVQIWGNNAGKYDIVCQAVESIIKLKLIFGKRMPRSGPEGKQNSRHVGPSWGSFSGLLLGLE